MAKKPTPTRKPTAQDMKDADMIASANRTSKAEAGEMKSMKKYKKGGSCGYKNGGGVHIKGKGCEKKG